MVLGVVGLIDQGELDCKVLAIEVNEAKERKIRNIEDYNRTNPGAVKEIIEWFRMYKTWEGKKVNKFCWNGEILSVDRTLELIQDSHRQYKSFFEHPEQNSSYNYWLGNNPPFGK